MVFLFIDEHFMSFFPAFYNSITVWVCVCVSRNTEKNLFVTCRYRLRTILLLSQCGTFPCHFPRLTYTNTPLCCSCLCISNQKTVFFSFIFLLLFITAAYKLYLVHTFPKCKEINFISAQFFFSNFLRLRLIKKFNMNDTQTPPFAVFVHIRLYNERLCDVCYKSWFIIH